MTANMPFPVMFAFFYPLFQKFWLLCRNHERGRYNMNEFHYWQDRIFKNSLQNINNLGGTRQNEIKYVAKWKEIIS